MKTNTEKQDYELAREELETLYANKCPQGRVFAHSKGKDASGWAHTAWEITIAGIRLEYKTGTGIKKTPTCAEVLACYCREGVDAETTFADWCGNFGYGEDSRKALETFLACQDNGEKALKILKSRDLYAKFAELSCRL